MLIFYKANILQIALYHHANWFNMFYCLLMYFVQIFCCIVWITSTAVLRSNWNHEDWAFVICALLSILFVEDQCDWVVIHDAGLDVRRKWVFIVGSSVFEGLTVGRRDEDNISPDLPWITLMEEECVLGMGGEYVEGGEGCGRKSSWCSRLNESATGGRPDVSGRSWVRLHPPVNAAETHRKVGALRRRSSTRAVRWLDSRGLHLSFQYCSSVVRHASIDTSTPSSPSFICSTCIECIHSR